MNTLIIYASLHGCTKKCTAKLSKYINGNLEIVNLKDGINHDLNKFSTIIIGSSIHTGHINPGVKSFCNKYLEVLLLKNIGIFLCFMDSIKKGEYYLKNSFPQKLLDIANVKGFFGGELDFNKLNIFEKLYIERTTKETKSVSKINENSIIEFGNKINKFITSN